MHVLQNLLIPRPKRACPMTPALNLRAQALYKIQKLNGYGFPTSSRSHLRQSRLSNPVGMLAQFCQSYGICQCRSHTKRHRADTHPAEIGQCSACSWIVVILWRQSWCSTVPQSKCKTIAPNTWILPFLALKETGILVGLPTWQDGPNASFGQKWHHQVPSAGSQATEPYRKLKEFLRILKNSCRTACTHRCGLCFVQFRASAMSWSLRNLEKGLIMAVSDKQ